MHNVWIPNISLQFEENLQALNVLSSNIASVCWAAPPSHFLFAEFDLLLNTTSVLCFFSAPDEKKKGSQTHKIKYKSR